MGHDDERPAATKYKYTHKNTHTHDERLEKVLSRLEKKITTRKCSTLTQSSPMRAANPIPSRDRFGLHTQDAIPTQARQEAVAAVATETQRRPHLCQLVGSL